ncbi:hypothetical protein HD806DRAFT_66134 [Xylariaceae sp. AK1471]|nr:hypothetical protein HD806DRAFT_66134 [Xylariaceae sp. AK1471]
MSRVSSKLQQCPEAATDTYTLALFQTNGSQSILATNMPKTVQTANMRLVYDNSGYLLIEVAWSPRIVPFTKCSFERCMDATLATVQPVPVSPPWVWTALYTPVDVESPLLPKESLVREARKPTLYTPSASSLLARCSDIPIPGPLANALPCMGAHDSASTTKDPVRFLFLPSRPTQDSIVSRMQPG